MVTMVTGNSKCKGLEGRICLGCKEDNEEGRVENVSSERDSEQNNTTYIPNSLVLFQPSLN